MYHDFGLYFGGFIVTCFSFTLLCFYSFCCMVLGVILFVFIAIIFCPLLSSLLVCCIGYLRGTVKTPTAYASYYTMYTFRSSDEQNLYHRHIRRLLFLATETQKDVHKLLPPLVNPKSGHGGSSWRLLTEPFSHRQSLWTNLELE